MRRNRTWLKLAVGVLLGGAVVGCGGVDRTANPDAGDYYTTEEFDKLSKEQRAAYCDELARLRSEYEAAEGSAKQAAESAESAISGLEGQLNESAGALAALEAEVQELEREVQEWKSQPRQYTVKRGDSLWKISGQKRIYGDPARWPRIYRANRDQITDADLIYPGWVLKIPRGIPKQHTVEAGEYLSLIASYWEIYGSASKWPQIYEANKDQISDANLIHPRQVLKIPR